MQKSQEKKTSNRFLDLIFASDKTKITLVGLLLAGFVLRFLVARRIPFSGDEMVHGVHPIGFIASGKLQIMDQAAVWFWLSDFFMQILGVTMIGARFTSILFGTALALVIFLLTKELFNKKVALWAAFLSVISTYQLAHVEANIDTTMTFFVFVALYLFVLAHKYESKVHFIALWLVMGVAVMVKPIALLFIPAFVTGSVLYAKERKTKPLLKKLALATVIGVLVISPVLVNNYLLYKDKGLLDLQFARFTGISKETYAGIASTIEGFKFSELFVSYRTGLPGFVQAPWIVAQFETFLVSMLALIGIFLFFRTKNTYRPLFALAFLIPFLFLAGVSLLSNHLLFSSGFICIWAGLACDKVNSWVSSKTNQSTATWIPRAIVFVLIVNSFYAVYTGPSQGLFGAENELGQLAHFKSSTIPQNALVITDGRIYRGRVVFSLWDKNYLEGNYFPELVTASQKIDIGQRIPVETYYIECVPDDCGWGTIKDQPDFNATMEAVTAFFQNQSQIVTTIKDRDGKPYFRVYKQTLALHPDVLKFAKSTHVWFYYPVAYKPAEDIFDNYATHGTFDTLLNATAKLILYLDVIIAVLATGWICARFYYSSL